MRAELLWRCTAQLHDGSFCDARGMEDMPFPICGRHAQQVHRRMREHEASRYDLVHEREMALAFGPEMVERRAARERERRRLLDEQSLVYYVRLGDHIKIGTTCNLKERLISLRCDPGDVLATEPGDRTLELARHKEFASERIGRRENFNPSRRLIAHIANLLAERGKPEITGYVASHLETN